MCHDDIELIAGDVGIGEIKKRKKIEIEEMKSIPILYEKYQIGLNNKFLKLDKEYREKNTEESKFVHAIDKLDPLVHELSHLLDWGPKEFDE